MLTLKVAKEKGVTIPKEDREGLSQDVFTHLLLPQILEASKLNDERKYYYFDKDGKLQKFDKDTNKAKVMKNEFLGIKKEPQNTNKPLSLEELVEVYVQLYEECQRDSHP